MMLYHSLKGAHQIDYQADFIHALEVGLVKGLNQGLKYWFGVQNRCPPVSPKAAKTDRKPV
jgi:hypothetical protein